MLCLSFDYVILLKLSSNLFTYVFVEFQTLFVVSPETFLVFKAIL